MKRVGVVIGLAIVAVGAFIVALCEVPRRTQFKMTDPGDILRALKLAWREGRVDV